MAHPIRPEKYAAIDNFYTATVYCKGAEVIRMYETLLGRDGFRKGMDLYFERHDGNAVTCEDFRVAMQDASGKDLTQFENWYLQAGTPIVHASDSWDASSGVFKIELKQTVPDTPGQTDKKPMHIPVRLGLLDRDSGKELVSDTVLELTSETQTFELKVDNPPASKPVPSLFRGFSAPVRLEYTYSDEELALLAGCDTDSFNRWEAMQRLGTKSVLDAMAAPNVESFQPDAAFVEAMRRTVTDRSTDDLSLIAYALALPVQGTLMELASPPIDPTRLAAARNRVRNFIGETLRSEFLDRYNELTPADGDPYVVDGVNASRRRLRGVLLGYLCTTCDAEAAALAGKHFSTAAGMTDKMVAFSTLCSMPESAEAKTAIQSFFVDAKGDANVVDKWFSAQARADVEDLLPRVKKLMEHPDFTLKNPNRLRAVVSVFLSTHQFHNPDGSGYDFAVELITEVDKLNPQMSSRLAGAFKTWRRLDESRQTMILERLEQLSKVELSKDCLEIVSKIKPESSSS
jgi:aminopeptidase N